MPHTNNHEYIGSVLARSQIVPYGTKGGNKIFLYCEGNYAVKGKVDKVQAKFVCFGHESSRNKALDVYPGDEIKFYFKVSGWFHPDEKDFLGVPKCYTDAVIDSPIEILNTSQRKMYNNHIDDPVVQAEIDDEDTGLPF